MLLQKAVGAACVCLMLWSPCSRASQRDFIFPKLHPWVGSHSDDACSRDSDILKKAALNGTLWAARMVDSSAAEVRGALWGQRYHLGSFDGCLSVGILGASPVGARYCLADVSLVLPPRGEGKQLPPPWSHVEELAGELPVEVALQGAGRLSRYASLAQVHVGLCVASSCGAEQLQAGLRAHLSHLRHVQVSVRPDMCTDHTELTGSGALSPAWLFWLLMMFFSGVTLLSPYVGWTHWNWRHHLRALTAPDAGAGGVSTAPLCGIRALTAFMIIIAHRRLMLLGSALTTNQFSREEDYTSVLLSPINHPSVHVDTFLFLSGFFALVLASGKRSNLHSLLLRLSRIAPLYWLAIVFNTFILPELGSGPVWKYFITKEADACRSHWLGNLFFIHNYIPTSYMCVGHSWSLAVDMHLFVVTLALRHSLRRGLSLLVPLLAVSLLVQAVQLIRVQSEVAILVPWLKWWYMFSHPAFFSVYVPTHMRATPYVMGIGLGMLAYGMQKWSVRLSLLWTWVLTAGGVLVLGAVTALQALVSDRSLQYSIWNVLFYHSGAPFLWCIGLAALVVALLFGVDTVIRDFLSWTPFVLISRLGYGIYFFGAIWQVYTVSNKRDVENVTEFSVFSQSVTDLAFASLVSLWLHFIIEAPAKSLVKSWLIRSNENTPKISSKKD